MAARDDYPLEGFDRTLSYANYRHMCDEIDALRLLVEQFTDPDPCEYDHHGYCQAHGWLDHGCPHARAKLLLKLHGGEIIAITSDAS